MVEKMDVIETLVKKVGEVIVDSVYSLACKRS